MSGLKYFSRKELACPHCGLYSIDDSFAQKLDDLRETYGKPIYVDSCCRCVDHNKDVGGSPNSTHLATSTRKTNGIDIRLIAGADMYNLVVAAIGLGFRGVIFYDDGHIHLDTRDMPYMGPSLDQRP